MNTKIAAALLGAALVFSGSARADTGALHKELFPITQAMYSALTPLSRTLAMKGVSDADSLTAQLVFERFEYLQISITKIVDLAALSVSMLHPEDRNTLEKAVRYGVNDVKTFCTSPANYGYLRNMVVHLNESVPKVASNIAPVVPLVDRACAAVSRL